MSNYKAIILHGTMSYPERNWFPWLKSELEKTGIEAYVPKLPTPENHNLENWLEATTEQCPKIDEKTLLIGHSCGANCVLHLLERLNVQIPYVALCGVVIHDIDNPEIDSLNKTFVKHSYDWAKIRSGAKYIDLIHGDNDPYVPLDQPEEVSLKLKIPLEIIKQGGHLNEEAGYTSFPLLLDKIKKHIATLNA